MCDIAWYDEFLGLNALERKRRDLVVAYAEGQGGVAEQYLRRAFPRFWQKVESTDFEAIGPSLGLTPPREADILTDMAKVVVPALRAAFPEGDAGDLRFPETVGHL